MDETEELDCTQALPDDWDNEESASNEQHHVAWLEISGSRHEVYEGETVIGRDAASCKIVIQNKVLSKQHAVIEVAGDMHHTIADLGSLNKTRIGKMILKPNVRYALQGGECLKFGDLKAKYTIKEEENLVDDSGSETGSESMLIMSDSEERPISPVISNCTAAFVPETPVPARIHSPVPNSSVKSYVLESPSISQSTPYPQKSHKVNMSLSPGCLSAMQDIADDDDESFFFDPSQPPKETALSTPEKENKHSTKPNTVGIEDSKVEGYNSDATTDIEDEGVPTQQFDVQADCINQEATDSSANVSNNKENSFISIDENVPDSGVGSSSKDTDVKITDDEEEGWNSDGSTDVEDDIFSRATQLFSNQDKSPKLLGNIDDVNNMSAVDKNFDDTQEIMAAFDDNDDEAMLPTQMFVANENPSNKKVQEVDDEDVPTQLFLDNEDEVVFKKPFATAPKNKKKSTELLSTNRGFDEDFPDDFLRDTANADMLDTPTQPYLSDEEHQPSSACNDDFLNAPTLPFDDCASPYRFQLPCRSAQREICSVSKAADEDVDDIFNQPTQPFSSNDDVVDGDIPTQYFDPTLEKEIPKKEDKYSEEKESDSEVDIYNQPTQMFSEQKDNNLDSYASAQPSNVASVAKSDNTASRENTCGKVDVTSHMISSLAHTKGQAKLDSNDDDDLPPTQIFSAPKGNSDVDCNARTQLFDGESVLHTENTKEGASKIEVTSSALESVVRIKGQNELQVNDDDLPLTQVFTAVSMAKEAADPVTMEDALSPTQPFIHEANKEIEDVVSNNALKVSGKCLADEKNDTSVSESEDDDCAPTQPFIENKENNTSDIPQPSYNESKECNRPLQGNAEGWDDLDADATQDISIDAVVGIDEGHTCTTIPAHGVEQDDHFEESSLDDAASDSSETLLNERHVEDEGGVLLSNLKIDDNHSASASENQNLSYGTDTENIEGVRDEEEEDKVTKCRGIDYLDTEKKERMKECSSGLSEKESYNSDESTDVEDSIPEAGNTSTITNEVSHAEPSSDLRNKLHVSPLCTKSPQMSYKQQNGKASSSCPPKVILEKPVQESKSNKKSFRFKRVCKVVPVVSTPKSKISTSSQSTQDSFVSFDFSPSINFQYSEDNSSCETPTCNKQFTEKKVKLSQQHRGCIDSGSDSEDNAFNFSRRLFDMPPDEDISFGNNFENEKMNISENEVLDGNEKVNIIENEALDGLEVDKKIKLKDVKTTKEVKQKGMAERKPEVDKGTMKIDERGVAHKDRGKVPADGETRKAVLENENTSDGISENDTSISVTHKTKKVLNLDTDSGKNSRIELIDSKREDHNFSGFAEFHEVEERDNTDRHKELNIEKNESGSETAEEKAKEEDDTSKKKELKVLETTSASVLSDGNVEEEQCVDDELNVTKTSDIHKQKRRKNEVKIESKLEENVLSERDKRKRSESMKMEEEEQSKTKRRTRTKIVESESKPSRRNSSSIDTSNGVTQEDIPNIRCSSRRRNKSDVSTLSSISNQSAATGLDEENGYTRQNKQKKAETFFLKVEEQTEVQQRRRTRYKDSDTEASSKNSSSSSDVMADDAQNIRHSSRRRKNSGTSTCSNLSHLGTGISSNQIEASSVSTSDTVRRGRRSKKSFSGRIYVPQQETEEIENRIIGSNFEKDKSNTNTNTSRERTSQNSSKSDSLPIVNEKNKTNMRSCRKRESADDISEKKAEIMTTNETSTVPQEVKNLACRQTRSKRVCKEPKRFDPDKYEVEALKRERRKTDVLQIIPQSSEKLPSRRTRRSAMPNLSVSTSVINDEEVEIVPAKEESNLELDKCENKKEMTQIPKRGRKSAAAKAKVVKENEALVSTPEADVKLNATKQPEEQNSRKSRSSVAKSEYIKQKGPGGSKKPRLSAVPEKTENGDSKETIEAGRRIQKRSLRSTTAAIERKSSVNDQPQVLEKKHSRRGRLPDMESSDDTAVEESHSSRSSSQSSEDSHVSQRSKRRRGCDNSMDELLSTPTSSRSGRSRMGSPSVLWSPSQRQQQASTKSRVLFTGYKDAQDEKIVTDLGGTVVEYPQECTVLVTTSIRRTCKLLAVIGRGLPIVSPTWLTVSKQARNFVDPWKFLVKDSEAEEKFGFCLEQSLQSASKVLLFEGLSIHATKSVKPPPDQMKEIIECSGGEYLDTSPKRYAPQTRIVSCQEDKKEWTTYKYLGIPILGTEFILTGLLRHELLLDEFLLE